MSEITFEFLADRLESIPILARWNHDEWGHFLPNRSYEDLCEQMHKKANKTTPPLHIIAIKEQEVVGGATLKIREMDAYPEKEFWLGSVVVSPKYRGTGIASKLALKVCDIAKLRSIDKLFLQTEALDGGLYARIGWEPIEEVDGKGDRVLIMRRDL